MENEQTSHSSKRDGQSLKRQIVHIDLRAANARRLKEMSKNEGALIQVLGGIAIAQRAQSLTAKFSREANFH